MKKINSRLKLIFKIMFCILLSGVLGTSVGMIINWCCNTWLHRIACIFLILTSLFSLIYILYSIFRLPVRRRDEVSVIEKRYRYYIFLNIASVTLTVIVMIALAVAVFVKLKLDESSVEIITNFYTAFIALCTTFVVGFQIYNSIDLNKKVEILDSEKRDLERHLQSVREKLEELDEEKQQLKEQTAELVKINKRCEYFNAYSIGTIRYNEAEMNEKDDPQTNKRYCWNAMRAYFNALKLASEGGQDFEEAWKSFGRTKIVKCLDKLIEIHEEFDYDYDAGDDFSIMPSYAHRERYIREISKFIADTRVPLAELKGVDDSLKNEYYSLTVRWNDFLNKYYSNI